MFFKGIDYDMIYDEKGMKVMKDIVHKPLEESMRSSLSNTQNSSYNSSKPGSLTSSKKIEVLSQVDTKRKKFMFIDVNGTLTVLSDNTVRYDQIYDNSSVYTILSREYSSSKG